MTSIRDITRLSGCSVSMVSRVLNHPPYMKEEKRAHIQKIIADLDYTANQNAVNLSIWKTKLISVILPSVNNPSISRTWQSCVAINIKSYYKIATHSSFFKIAG